MTPRDVDAMSPEEYRTFVAYQNREIRAQERAVRKAK